MSNSRIVALIGVGGAIAALASSPIKSQGVRRLEWPDIDVISVRPDTIWFCAAPRWDQPRLVTYAFVRAAREWRAMSAPRACLYRPTRMMPEWDVTPQAVTGASGVRLEIVDRAHLLRLTDPARGRLIDLAAPVDSARIKALAKAAGVDAMIAVGFEGPAVNDSLIWIGLAGGYSEYGGWLGGLYRVDRRTGAWSYIVDSTLAANTVTGLGQTRDWLWIGTERPTEDGWVGRAGLLRRDLGTGATQAFTPANSPLPDALIRGVATDDDVVAIATDKGLAVAELRRSPSPREIERWNVAYFVPVFAGDSLVFRLGGKAEAASPADEARHSFAQVFGREGGERLLYEALAGVPAAAVERALERAPYQTPGLEDPAFAPALQVMLSISRGDAQRRAVDAIAKMGQHTPASLRAASRDAFTMFDTLQALTGNDYLNRRELAKALRSFGDTTALRWSHALLDRADLGVVGWPSRRRVALWAAIGIVADAKDERGLAQLEALAGDEPRLDKDVVLAMTLYDSPRAWQSAMNLFERRNPDPQDPFYYARVLIGQATPTALANLEIRARVAALLDEWLRSQYSGNRQYALERISKLRLGQYSQALVAMLADTSTFIANSAYASLVSLYGRSDAPIYRDPVPATAISWWKTLLATGSAPVVPLAQGEKAAEDWWRRKIAAFGRPPG